MDPQLVDTKALWANVYPPLTGCCRLLVSLKAAGVVIFNVGCGKILIFLATIGM
ncbi:MAG: hypothetical protein ACRCUG_09850 [Yersinia sp. (in: enterobacteria)]